MGRNFRLPGLCLNLHQDLLVIFEEPCGNFAWLLPEGLASGINFRAIRMPWKNRDVSLLLVCKNLGHLPGGPLLQRYGPDRPGLRDCPVAGAKLPDISI